jgi:hypothetical protein
MKHIQHSATSILAAATIAAALSSPAANASPPSQLTVVMVHGAWADTSSWDGEIAALKQKGYRA